MAPSDDRQVGPHLRRVLDTLDISEALAAVDKALALRFPTLSAVEREHVTAAYLQEIAKALAAGKNLAFFSTTPDGRVQIDSLGLARGINDIDPRKLRG